MLNPERALGSRPVDGLARNPVPDALAAPLARAMRALRDRSPAIKDALSGTWLGHALHPLLTDVPVGAFSALGVLDVAECFGADVSAAADIVLGFGIISGAAAAVAGLSDWSDTEAGPLRIGFYHGALNGTALAAFTVSFALRRSDSRRAAWACDGLGLLALFGAGYLGGELTTGMQLGVRHTAVPLEPADEFVDVAASSDVSSEKPLRTNAGGTGVVLVRTGGTLYALADACSHRGASLGEGTLEDGCLRCPWHGSRFALHDGGVREGPATFAQPVYEVREIAGRVLVRPAEREKKR